MDIDFDALEDHQLDPATADLHPDTARVMAELDRKTAARRLAVPTRDPDVRLRLREMGEPITLFGEWPEDRRDRLRHLWSEMRKEEGGDGDVSSEEESSDEEEKEEEFYTEGTSGLKDARRKIADFSLDRARKRITRQRHETLLPLGRLMDVRRAVFNELKSFTNLGSQIGDTRPLGSLRFSPDSKLLLTSSWTGNAKIWSVPACKEIKTYRALNFATSGADHDVKLWSLDSDAPLKTLTGHSARVCRVAFHPTGRYLGSASFDGTWRLWDVETGGEELLLQEGHSKEVYAIEFQEDGALVCTGGLDAIGRVWDLRSGKTAMVLDGHVKDILGIDFAPNGHQIATGSNDDTVRIWDLRSLKSIKTIHAHKSAISDVKFFRFPSLSFDSYPKVALPKAFEKLPAFEESARDPIEAEGEKVDMPLSGLFLVSGGYDGKVKVWSADDWQLVKSMTSDENGKVMGVDVSSDGRFLASAEYSRTYKLWSHPDVDLS
ncbi:hypothetical protein MNV49_006120 [Pseudohyphozyma bogoriensis]|nr:hypothetical protein MNV49_006120 [Pseudohyphozyma bogoriensis]